MKHPLSTLAAVVSIGITVACSTQPQQPQSPAVATTVAPDYQWVQFGAEGKVIARAIFKQSEQACPAIEATDFNGQTAAVAMSVRAATMPDAFAVTMCEATLPAPGTLRSASLGGKRLALPARSPKRIVVIGDTGCRVSTSTQQNCNNNPAVPAGDAEKWLFTTTIESAARLKPDLVIHVGDYIYREAACQYPDRCGGSPDGDDWATWDVDFFDPARALLETAPWVFARGNHESCQREWRGWYLFLDPHAVTNTSWTACAPTQERSAPFQVPLDGLDLVVMDTAPDTAALADYQAALQTHSGAAPAWFITHRPLWAIGDNFSSTPPSGVIPAAQKANVQLLVAGHLHSFAMIQFSNGSSPSQMIAGGGATELDPPVPPAYFQGALKGFGADPGRSEVLRKFTFALVEVQGASWQVAVIDEDGTTEARRFVVNKK